MFISSNDIGRVLSGCSADDMSTCVYRDIAKKKYNINLIKIIIQYLIKKIIQYSKQIYCFVYMYFYINAVFVSKLVRN